MSGPDTMQESLLAEIARFINEHRMGETTFGRRAVNDADVVKRLRRGGITFNMAQRLRDFMAAHQQTSAAN